MLKPIHQMKPFLFQLPEYALVLLVLSAAYTPPFSFNPLVLIAVAALALQLIFKNRVTGLLIGGLFLLANLFFLGAVVSEFAEFPQKTSDAYLLLIGGFSVFLLTMAMSVMMIYKYAVQQEVKLA